MSIAQAMAIDEQVRAYGGPRFQLTQQVMGRFAEAIEAARVDVAPKIMIHGGGGANGTPATGSVMEALLTLLLADRMAADAPATPPAPRSAAAAAVRSRIEQGLREQK